MADWWVVETLADGWSEAQTPLLWLFALWLVADWVRSVTRP